MKVLVIEDAHEVMESIALCVAMRWPACTILCAPDGRTGLRLVQEESPDLVTLDLLLPDVSGVDLLGEIRRFSDIPVLILSAVGDEADRIRGLERGADDYLVKPFSHTELLARIHAILRRTQGLEPWKQEGVVSGGDISIDLTSGRAYVHGQEAEFSATEWKLLSYLVRNAGKVMTPQSLAANVWGLDFVESSTIKMCVRRLRQKLGDDTHAPHIIRSHRRRGYSFELKR